MTNPSLAAIATEFLSMCAAGEVRAAYARHVADGFVHHNPWFASDRESLLVAMEDSAAAEPNKAFTVKQVIASADRVATLSHLQRAGTGPAYAVVHILRFDGDRIVEMWDVAQEIPADTPNALGMF